VDAASAHLHAEGIDVKPPAIAPYGMKQLFFMTLMVRFLLAGIILFPSWLFVFAPDLASV